MILIARIDYQFGKEPKYIKRGEIFKGWDNGALTVFIKNKRTEFSCHKYILHKYFRIWGDIGERG